MLPERADDEGVTMGVLVRYRWWALAGVALLVGVVVGAVVWWPGTEPVVEPRARDYREFDVCVLTPGAGLADPHAAAVWAGAQEVSLAQRVPVLYLPVAGEQTPQRAAEYLASLVAQDCEVIVAVGAAPVAAVAANEANYAGATIVAVGDEIDDSGIDRIAPSTVDVLSALVPTA
jgi:hypothetical protein